MSVTEIVVALTRPKPYDDEQIAAPLAQVDSCFCNRLCLQGRRAFSDCGRHNLSFHLSIG